MNWVSLIFISISLAMDAFVVSVCDGLQYGNLKKWQKVTIALTFGLFQGAMPIGGYFIGELFIQYIADYDHWVAFGLLFLIGAFMIFEGVRDLVKKEVPIPKKFSIPMVLLQGVATSIDALIVGITLTSLGINIFVDGAVITGITFVISLIGVFLGKEINRLLRGKTSVADIIAGLILIGLGISIILEHMVW